MDYTKFSITDFLCDEFFQNWVIHQDNEISTFWKDWLETHPEKKETVEQARNILLALHFKEEFPTNEQIQKALKRNLTHIHSIEEQKKQSIHTPAINRFKQIRKIAAIFAGIAIVGGGIFYHTWFNAKVSISTTYGEIKTINLPDSSLVTLNAHSTLSYAKHWHKNQVREVSLKGEAFFNVHHLNKDKNRIRKEERFIVHTQDLNVEVLGTSFDIYNRQEKTEVVLKTGKVILTFTNPDHPLISMEPGEIVTYNGATRELTRSVTNPENYSAWTAKKLILTNATVNDVIQFIEDTYGYQVLLEDPAIGNKKMEGTLLLDNLQDILFVLSTSLDIKIEKGDSTLHFVPNH